MAIHEVFKHFWNNLAIFESNHISFDILSSFFYFSEFVWIEDEPAPTNFLRNSSLSLMKLSIFRNESATFGEQFEHQRKNGVFFLPKCSNHLTNYVVPCFITPSHTKYRQKKIDQLYNFFSECENGNLYIISIYSINTAIHWQ